MTAGGQTGERHSPQTSPRFTRRSTTPSLMAVQNDLYAAGTLPALSLATSTGCGGNVVSGGNSGVVGSINGSSAAQKSNNRMSAPLIGASHKPQQLNNNVNNSNGDIYGQNRGEFGYKELNATYAVLSQWQDTPMGVKQALPLAPITPSAYSSPPTNLTSTTMSQNTLPTDSTNGVQQAPPLPPRKSSPGVSDCSFTQSLGTNGVINKIYGCTTSTNTSSTPSKSLDNITVDELDVPLTTAPPVPTLSSSSTGSLITTHTLDLMTEDMRQLGRSVTPSVTPIRSILDEDIEVGPAETIMGVIDTRPLEARQAAPTAISKAVGVVSGHVDVNLMDCVSAHYSHLCTATSIAPSQSNNNLDSKRLQQYYQQQQQQQSTSTQQQSTSTQQQQHKQQQQQPQQRPQQKLLYENVTINQKDCNNVPYENINLEYITRLMSEGYSKENAITALGISRNNIEMACDILREFVSKSSV